MQRQDELKCYVFYDLEAFLEREEKMYNSHYK